MPELIATLRLELGAYNLAIAAGSIAALAGAAFWVLRTRYEAARGDYALGLVNQSDAEEIARILHVEANTAKVRLHRARTRLKEKMETHFGVSPDNAIAFQMQVGWGLLRFSINGLKSTSLFWLLFFGDEKK